MRRGSPPGPAPATAPDRVGGFRLRREEALERLAEGVARLTTSDAWRAWLDVQARFHRYSFGNAVLILLQRPSASRVAGFHAWRRLGRGVRRGEHAIWILAPVMRRVVPAGTDASAGGAEDLRVLDGFRPVPVFDVAQTDGAPLPEISTRLAGDAPAHAYAHLVGVAGALGFTVEDHAFADGTNGDCSHALRRIRVEAANAPAQRVKTLAHEIAHALLHGDEAAAADRPLAELEAESVAYAACAALGLDSGAYSFGYVAGWAGGGEAALAQIKACGGRIQRTVDQLLAVWEDADGRADHGGRAADIA